MYIEFTHYIEFEVIDECEVEVCFWHQPEETDTNTPESITVDSAVIKYERQKLDVAKRDLKHLEQACWDHLEKIANAP